MNTILRNLLITLRRFKLASALNIFGLAVAFVSFVVILMEVHHGMTYNRCYDNYRNTYRLEVSSDGVLYNALVGRNWERMIKEKFPQIENVTLHMSYSPLGDYIKVEKTGDEVGFYTSGHLVLPNFPNVFGFEMIEGDQNALQSPGNAMIPQSMAKRFWGDESALGKKLAFADSDTIMSVGGVFRDLPKNGMIPNVIFYPAHPEKRGAWDGWQFNYQLFVSLQSDSERENLEKMIYDAVQKEEVPYWIKEYKSIRLNPIADIYFDKSIEFDASGKGDAKTTAILLGIALLVLGIASVNFVNFATALTPLRIKSINTQKVLGNPASTIRTVLVAEAVGISLIAYGISLVLFWGVGRTRFVSLFSADLSFENNISLLVLGAVVALTVGGIAGIYPSFYATKFPPALVLKGSFGSSVGGRRLRTALISFQFVVSAILIIVASFMNLQNRFLRSVDLGYNTEQTVIVNLGRLLLDKGNVASFRTNLFSNPQIKTMAASQFLFGSGGAQSNSFQKEGVDVNFDFLPVTPDLLKCFNIKVLEGRDFQESDSYTPGVKAIFNKAAMERYKLTVGETLDNNIATIVGVMDNIHFKSLHESNTQPLCFAVVSDMTEFKIPMPNTYIKITGNVYDAIDHIKKCVAEIDPAFPVTISFFDEVFDNLYQREVNVARLITVFSLLAVILSLMGVFGLVVFETEYRRKEIAVRRILGSTVAELLVLLNRRYVKITIGCFVVATPIAYYGMSEWLSQFVYRTPLYWWVFAVAFVVVAVVTVTTVTIQSWRTANENPARSLKSE